MGFTNMVFDLVGPRKMEKEKPTGISASHIYITQFALLPVGGV